METLYTYSAAIAGTLFVGQLLLSFTGFGDHGDLDHVDVDLDADGEVAGDGFDHGGEWFVGLLSFRALVSALTVFGLAGLAAGRYFEPMQAFTIAAVSGGGMLYGTGTLLRNLYRLKSEGNVYIEHTVGLTGSVYLTVPAKRSGRGKVTVSIQGRTMEYEAITADEELPSGTPVVVLDVLGAKMIEVARATETYTEAQEETHA